MVTSAFNMLRDRHVISEAPNQQSTAYRITASFTYTTIVPPVNV